MCAHILYCITNGNVTFQRESCILHTHIRVHIDIDRIMNANTVNRVHVHFFICEHIYVYSFIYEKKNFSCIRTRSNLWLSPVGKNYLVVPRLVVVFLGFCCAATNTTTTTAATVRKESSEEFTKLWAKFVGLVFILREYSCNLHIHQDWFKRWG